MDVKKKSNFWKRVIIVLWVLYASLIVSMGFSDETIKGLLLLVIIIGFIISYLAIGPYVTEHKQNILLATPPAEEVLTQDRPYIVYLRSFKDEQSILKRYRKAWPTEGEQIAAAFKAYGSMIAISNPDEELPALGASRLSATDATWEEKVKRLL